MSVRITLLIITGWLLGACQFKPANESSLKDTSGWRGNFFTICNETEVDIDATIALHQSSQGASLGNILLPKKACTRLDALERHQLNGEHFRPQGNSWYFQTSLGQLIPDSASYANKTSEDLVCLPDQNAARYTMIYSRPVRSADGRISNDQINCESREKKFGWGHRQGFGLDNQSSGHNVFYHIAYIRGGFIRKNNSEIPLSEAIKQGGSDTSKVLSYVSTILSRLQVILTKTAQVLADWPVLLEPYLDLDVNLIDVDYLPEEVPQWFKDLVTRIQQGVEKLNQDLKLAANQIKAERSANQKALQAAIGALGQVLTNEELAVEFTINEAEIEDNQIAQREHAWITRLASHIDRNERVEFLNTIYQWEEESKTSEVFAIEKNIIVPGYYNTFIASQNRIRSFIDQYVDQNYLFHDAHISKSFRNLIDGPLRRKNPQLADRIKSKFNFRPDQGEKSREIIGHMEVVAEAYVQGGDAYTETYQSSLIDDMLGFMDVIGDITTCIAKTSAAGLYASFYEVFESKDFCTGEPLDGIGQVISWVGLGADVASRVGVKAAGGIVLLNELRRVFRIAAPVFKKAKSNVKEMSDLVIAIARSSNERSLTGFVGSIRNKLDTARRFGARSTNEIKDFTESATRSGMWASGRRVGGDPATLLKNGRISAEDLADIVPKGTPNIWNPSAGTSFAKGFKYEWTYNGSRYHVHGHTIDPTAPVGSNAASGWTVRVKIDNRWLKTDGTTTRNTTLYANETHIPFKPILE